MRIQLTHVSYDDCENTHTLSYYHHQIGYVCFILLSSSNRIRVLYLIIIIKSDTCALSYYHHQIGSMTHLPLFRIRSWMVCAVCLSIILVISHMLLVICGSNVFITVKTETCLSRLKKLERRFLVSDEYVFFLVTHFFSDRKYHRIDIDPTSMALDSVDPRVFDMWDSALPLAGNFSLRAAWITGGNRAKLRSSRWHRRGRSLWELFAYSRLLVWRFICVRNVTFMPRHN